MKDVVVLFVIFLIIVMCMNSESKETPKSQTKQCSNKSFICYDETRFYHCVKNENGGRSVQGYLRSCPLGLVCNNLNEFECEEDISKEFLTEQKYYFTFGGKVGRKRIIDD